MGYSAGWRHCAGHTVNTTLKTLHDHSRRLRSRPEGRAALDKGIEIATRRNERLVVVNAGPADARTTPTSSTVTSNSVLEERLATLPIEAEFAKVRASGKSTIEEIEEMAPAP